MFAVRVALLFCFSACAHAASFDCKAASTRIERMICADAELSDLDKVLGDVYELESRRSDVADLRTTQRAWIKRRDQCAEKPCVAELYEQRITSLCNEGERVTGGAYGMSACASMALKIAERTLAEHELKRAEAHAQESDEPNEVRELYATEAAAWRAYRDASCRIKGANDGGVWAWQAAFSLLCMAEQTQARASELRASAADGFR